MNLKGVGGLMKEGVHKGVNYLSERRRKRKMQEQMGGFSDTGSQFTKRGRAKRFLSNLGKNA